LKVKWIVQDEIGTTNDGTRQEDFGYLDVFQNKRIMNVEIYHFKNKKDIVSSILIIIINIAWR
jgi:hypothetical protein